MPNIRARKNNRLNLARQRMSKGVNQCQVADRRFGTQPKSGETTLARADREKNTKNAVGSRDKSMKAIIEIPKGDDRRRHIKSDKSGFIDLGPTKDVISVNDGIMPIHYGYIPETLNKKEGDEIDVLILSEKQFFVGQKVEIEPVALIRREDGDDKIVAVDETRRSMKIWSDIPETERKLIEKFFSYQYKFISIDGTDEAREYIKRNQTIKS